MPRYMLDERGLPVPRDESEFLIWLCCHGETPGGAWKVSLDGHDSGIFFLPQSLADRGDAVGGFERMDRRCQRELVPIHQFSMPAWLAVEKRIRRAA